MKDIFGLLLSLSFLYTAASLPLENELLGRRSMLAFPIAKSALKLKSVTGPRQAHRLRRGLEDLTEVVYDRSFLVEVAFGDQTVDLIADTGSSNAWAITPGYICESGWTCYFGPSVEIENTFDLIEGQHMNSTYADGSYINGIVANVSLSIAGITIPEQYVGLATLAAFVGDGTSSGLIGLGMESGTSVYDGTDPSSDSYSAKITYSSVMNTIFADSLAPPLFAMAISRDASGTGFGGYLTIGSIPDLSDPYVNASSEYATVGFLTEPGTNTVNGYGIEYDGLSWTGGASNLIESTLVDSGTIFIYIPGSAAAAVNALFDPPATLDRSGLYEIDCKAIPPTEFAVIIGGVSFPINPADMIWYNKESGNICYSAVQNSGFIGSNILGDPFMRSVLAVYDWGNEQMHIASRVYYES